MSEFTLDTADTDIEELTAETQKRLGARSDNIFENVTSRLDSALESLSTTEGQQFDTREIRTMTDDVMADFRKDEANLAKVVADLHKAAKAQGTQLGDLENLQHPDAQKLLARAKAEHEAAQKAVNDATVAVGLAENMGFFAKILGKKARAISEAESRKSAAKARLAKATTALEEAPAEAARLNYEALQSMSMDESAQQVQLLHDNANNIIRERIDSAEQAAERRIAVITTTRDRLGVVTEESHEAEKRLEELAREIDKVNARLESGEVERQTPAYRELEAELTNLNTEHGQTKAKMDAATGEAQELEEKLSVLEMQRDALLTLKGNYERSLRIGVAAAKINREVTTVRLELVKGMADLGIQTDLNRSSRAQTVDSHQAAADLISAIEHDRVSYLKDHPVMMEALKTIQNGLDDIKDDIAAQDAHLREEWQAGRPLDQDGGASPTNPAEKRDEAFSL